MSGRFVAPSLEDAILIELQPVAGEAGAALSALRRLRSALSAPSEKEAACLSDTGRLTAYLRGIRAYNAISRLRDTAFDLLTQFSAGKIEVSRLAALRLFKGASPAESPLYHYVVRTDVEPGCEEELERWYDDEHMPALAAVPGVVLAQRLVSLDAGPRFYACYDLVSPDVLASEEWQAVRGTEWSSRVRATFRNTQRTVSRWLPDFALSE